MTNLKHLSKELVLAIDWAAAEYKYLEELKRELQTVEGKKDIKKEIKIPTTASGGVFLNLRYPAR